MSITRALAKFAVETAWDDLPPAIVRETKLVLMDSIGCALGALTTDKGKMHAALARRLGGPPESSVIGVGEKVSCLNAALANGELILTLDYSNIIAGGHDGAYVIPAPLAMAESVGATGKELIVALSLGLEVSARLARATGRHNLTPEDVKRQRAAGRGLTGNAYSNFGAAAAAGRLLGFDEARMLHALGVAGHLCMVLSYGRWGHGGRRHMTKYGVPGWQSTGAVTAALLAEMGYTGDTTVLDDSEHGFPWYVGYRNWYPEAITDRLGEAWSFDVGLHYKPYPCCGVFHAALDCFYGVIDEHDLRPEEIESVTAYCRSDMETPPFEGISGAQFNPRYVFAVAAHRVRRGVEWYDPDTMNDPGILAFMAKVSCHTYPDYPRALEEDPLANPSKVEVVARGKTFTEERMYRRGTVRGEVRPSEEEIAAKFRHNAERVLTAKKTEKAIETLLALEDVEDVSELMRHVSPR